MKHYPKIPAELVAAAETALADVADARSELALVTSSSASAPERRRAHAAVESAYATADARLREIASLLKQGSYSSYREWTQWRRRLSQLDTAHQRHLFAEADDGCVQPMGTIRAIDTGMSAPRIGDLHHGESRPPGSPATYGIDVDTLCTAACHSEAHV